MSVEENYWRQLVWRLAVCSLLFALLVEWVRPLVALSDMTDIHVVQPLLIAVLSFMILDVIRVPGWLGWPLKLLMSYAIIGYFFHGRLFIGLSWWTGYYDIVAADLMSLLNGTGQVSGENKTLVLFIALALMIYVVQSLMFVWQSASYFIAATCLYLFSLQIWAGLDTTAGMMRAFAIGLTLLFMLNIVKIRRTFAVNMPSAALMRKWLGAGVAVIVLTVTLGAGAASILAADDMPQPIWEHAWLAQSRHVVRDHDHEWAESLYYRSGYSGQQARLGGRILPDDRIVFIAQIEQPVYWRGESKSVYNGQGWVDGIGVSGSAAGSVELMEDARKHNLQLPEQLPDRIQRLSEAIVGTETGEWRQAKLIEQYLKHELAYNFEDVHLPRAGQDFVDHFLFEQQFGYCDHFSTAMVIMLRTIGIPARWVKGFATGELTDESFAALKAAVPDVTKHGQPAWLEPVPLPGYSLVNSQEYALDSEAGQHLQSVIVRSLHAHSWVEAYIEGQGWVAFEPTPQQHFGSPTLSDSALASESEVQGGLRQMFSIEPWLAFWQEHRKTAMAKAGQAMPYALGLLFGLALVGSLYVVLAKRMKAHWMMWQALRHSQKTGKRTEVVSRLCEALWLKVMRQYGAIAPSQTIREYVANVANARLRKPSQREALDQFANMYERLRYNSAETPYISIETVARIWKKIMS